MFRKGKYYYINQYIITVCIFKIFMYYFYQPRCAGVQSVTVKSTGCGFPLEEMKYLFKFIFPFLGSGVEAKRGIERTQCLHTSLLTSRRILVVLFVEWRNSTPRFASTPERRHENVKYFISSSGNRIHNLSRLHMFVLLHHDWSQYSIQYQIILLQKLTTLPQKPSPHAPASPPSHQPGKATQAKFILTSYNPFGSNFISISLSDIIPPQQTLPRVIKFIQIVLCSCRNCHTCFQLLY